MKKYVNRLVICADGRPILLVDGHTARYPIAGRRTAEAMDGIIIISEIFNSAN